MASSFLDIDLARHGSLLPEAEGLHWARVGTAEWVRGQHETNSDFLARARIEAKAEGWRILTFGGAIRLYTETDTNEPKPKGGPTHGRFMEDSENG
jgi:hypothetical protein